MIEFTKNIYLFAFYNIKYNILFIDFYGLEIWKTFLNMNLHGVIVNKI